MITSIREFMDNEIIRVSCAALARIIIDDKYLLCMNKNHAKNGRQVYTPFGGGLQYDNTSLPFLNSLDVVFERDEPDLRFTFATKNLKTFENWFYKRTGRETIIDRELYEEIVEEEKLLNSLNSADYTSKFINTVVDIQKYDDKYADMKNAHTTHRYFEIYEVNFSDDINKQFIDKCINNSVALLSKEEIIRGISNDGIKIGANAKSIL